MQNESALVANALKPFFQKLGFEAHTGYKQKNNSEIDLALMHENKVKVIIEAKKPDSKDFITSQNINVKSLHEAILYYFRERESNHYPSFIIITDFYRFYIFHAREFEKFFYQNKEFKRFYNECNKPNSLFKNADSNDMKTQTFYDEVKRILDSKNY
ncbi:hypothetical protein LS71_008185 [Helicobacter jaachi]|uniref:DUF7149 domain-containing protein n=1 Tax=Helicobacter jaachi TaxID=1677920 RepID=A0A4U8T763_9HELI|nr:hypothetical protein [Helicobacter jaachi]TLD95476.1 hypothetical protein LS71_008185 [Helicobacter jaachi]